MEVYPTCLPKLSQINRLYNLAMDDTHSNFSPPTCNMSTKTLVKKTRGGCLGGAPPCKRPAEINSYPYHMPSAMPAQVARRNERERNRVKQVNLGFATLRQYVPNGIRNKKLSKVETLRSAVDYIRVMQKLLEEQEAYPSAVIKEEEGDSEGKEGRQAKPVGELAVHSAFASATTSHCINSFTDSENDVIPHSTSSCDTPDSEYDFFKTESVDFSDSGQFLWYPSQ